VGNENALGDPFGRSGPRIAQETLGNQVFDGLHRVSKKASAQNLEGRSKLGRAGLLRKSSSSIRSCLRFIRPWPRSVGSKPIWHFEVLRCLRSFFALYFGVSFQAILNSRVSRNFWPFSTSPLRYSPFNYFGLIWSHMRPWRYTMLRFAVVARGWGSAGSVCRKSPRGVLIVHVFSQGLILGDGDLFIVVSNRLVAQKSRFLSNLLGIRGPYDRPTPHPLSPLDYFCQAISGAEFFSPCHMLCPTHGLRRA